MQKSQKFWTGNVVKKVILLVMMMFGLVLVCEVPSFAKAINNEDRIDQLFNQRELLLAEGKGVKRTDKGLEKCGVRKISNGYVKKNYPEIYQSIYQSESMNKNNPRLNGVSKPRSFNTDFFKYVGKVKYKGIWYRTERIVAQPKNRGDSNLQDTGSKLIFSDASWKKGMRKASVAFLKAVASETVAGEALSIYDILSEYVGGVSESTIIYNIKALYMWNASTTATFIFVVPNAKQKKLNAKLMYVDTSCSVVVQYSCPKIAYGRGYSVRPDIVGGKKWFKTGVRSTKKARAEAVKNYASNWGTTFRHVGSIKLTGIGGKKIVTLYPLSPSTMSAID